MLFSFLACKEETKATETYKYNAFFSHPEDGSKYSGKKIYVGTVTGLSSCKYIVSNYYAKRRKLLPKEGWDYICCLDSKEDACKEQHRYGED